jgi:hypothetical protein
VQPGDLGSIATGWLIGVFCVCGQVFCRGSLLCRRDPAYGNEVGEPAHLDSAGQAVLGMGR